jgi:Na+/proline symporter
MEKRKSTEEKVQETINSINGLQRAVPAPFFFTRVMARLQNEEASPWERVAVFLTRPTVALATLVLVILLNAAAFYVPADSSVIADNPDPSYTDDYVAANNTNIFEYEIADAGQ